MTQASTLLALAEKVEAAVAADRNTDAMIHHAIKNGIGVGYAADAPAYTASLDAAITLVPEGWQLDHLGWDWILGRWSCALTTVPSDALRAIYANGGTIRLDDARTEAATPALALTAACLKALATQTGETGS